MVSEAKAKPLKELAREIFAAALEEVSVPRAFARKVERRGSQLRFDSVSLDLAAFRQACVVSLGKAAWPMAESLAALLAPDYAARGVVVSNVPPRELAGFRGFQGGHPLPNEQSFAAADAILELLRGAGERTLVFFLISGGGSALIEKPLDPSLTLEDMQEVNRVLVGCGASIEEINAIRKHLSAVKGGRLAEAAGQATQVTFLVSDVPEGKLDAVASGPTLPDSATVEDCYAIAARYELVEQFPERIARLFRERKLAETPKAGLARSNSLGTPGRLTPNFRRQVGTGQAAFARSEVCVLLSSRELLHAAHRAAGARGFLAECDMTCAVEDLPLERGAECLLERLEQMGRENPGQPVCLIAGGEVLSPVPPSSVSPTSHELRVTSHAGLGGRNQAFVLHCVEKIAGRPSYAEASEGREVAVLSAGTDGIDGNSPAAGAVADGASLDRARALGLDPEDCFRRADSFRFFDALGDTLVTGPLATNLRDLCLFLVR